MKTKADQPFGNKAIEVPQNSARKAWSRPEIIGLSVSMTSGGNGNGDECAQVNKDTFITCSGA